MTEGNFQVVNGRFVISIEHLPISVCETFSPEIQMAVGTSTDLKAYCRLPYICEYHLR